MKTIVKITAILMLFLIAIPLQAQTPPVPPKPPKKPVQISVHSDDDSSSYSYSVSSSDSNGKNKKTSTSVSISNSDDSYSFRAKFPSSKSQEVLNALKKEMNNNNLSRSNNKYIWNSESNGDEVYKVLFSGTKLSMFLDKDVASSSLEEKFETLGQTIRTVIVGEENEKRREAERLQREADRLVRDAQRMQREADRISREAKRQAATISNQYKNDAKRIAEEAKRIAQKASLMSREAAHKGGISSYVRSLLGNDKTFFAEDTSNSFNWNWPALQSELIDALKKDNLINTDNDLNFTYDNSGMYANGKKLSTSSINRYKQILSKNKLSSDHLFSLYKGYKHIVIIDKDPDLEGLIKDLTSKGFISNRNEKVTFKINGISVYKNETQLSTTDLSSINTLLYKNNIIPAPGKIFEVIQEDAYKIGYAINGRGHLGTWKLTN